MRTMLLAIVCGRKQLVVWKIAFSFIASVALAVWTAGPASEYGDHYTPGESWNGSGWTVQNTPDPPGAELARAWTASGAGLRRTVDRLILPS